MRRHFPLYILAILFAHLSGCGEAPSRPSVITDRPVNPPKTSARYIQVPWDISLFFNIPGGAIVSGATTGATPGAAAEGDNLTGVYSNSNGFGGTLSGVLTGTLESGTFNGSLKTIMSSGCTAERQFSGPVTTQALSWSPGNHVNDCGGTSPLAGQIQVTAAQASAPPCTPYSSVASETSFAAAGGTGTVTVTAGAGCTWFATSSAGFVTVSAPQGTGNSSVQYTVVANSSTTARTATLVVAGQGFTITQAAVPAPVCTYALNDTGRTFDAGGALGGVDMRAPAGCAWTAVSDAPWLTITGGSAGSGDGTISFAVAANPGASQRVGRITANGSIFTVTQSGINCAYTVTPPATSAFPSEGGTGTLSVAVQAACPWAATSNAPWITLTPPTSGSGSGTVAFTVASNPNGVRLGAIVIAGQTVQITQSATLGRLSGTVTNTLNGGPIAGATVSIGALQATTDTGGNYSLTNVPLGTHTVRTSAPELITRLDTVVVDFQTTHNVPLTPATPMLAFAFNANPIFPNDANRHCGEPDNLWCWTYTNVLQESGGATLTVTGWEINQYNTDGGVFRHTVLTAADFARFYNGATSVPANGTATGGAVVWFGSSSGGTIEIVISGVDTFNRPHRFVTLPRLSAQERAVDLRRAAPGGTSKTAPPPRPRGGEF